MTGRRHSLSLALGLVVLTTAVVISPASAQSPSANPVIQRLGTLGVDSSHTERFAQVLFDSIGPRLSGTPGQRRGNDWLVATYKAMGIEARNEPVGTWRGWRRGHSHIDLLSPRARTLEGTMLGYSPGTGGRDLRATTVILPAFRDSTEFVAWLPAVRGKFVLLSPAQPTCRPTENWAQHATPASKEKMDSLRARNTREWRDRVAATGYSLALGTGSLGLRLEQAGAAGAITSRPKDAWGTIEIFETYNTSTPAVALSCEDYGLVYRLTENNQHPELQLNLDAELLGEQPIFNTVAMIPGTEKPDEYVVLSAHFDSWDGGSGATDNGTGTITMLEAARLLTLTYPRPKRTIVIGHWTAEENGLVGSRAFAEDHPEIVTGLQALLNQDNGTGRVIRMGAAGLPSAALHITSWLGQVPSVFREQVSFNGPGFPSGGGSDDASFACHGAPAFSLGALGWDYFAYTWHTNRDTYDKVVFDDLKANATLTAMLAYLAADDPGTITRERVDLAALAAAAARSRANGPGAGRGGRIPTAWPECQQAPRSTNHRLR